MTILNTLPEQSRTFNDFYISREFKNLIDSLPFYSGVVLEDGKTVNLGFAQSQGFDPILPLRPYIMGLIYAVATNHHSNTHVPKELEGMFREEYQREVDKAVKEFSLVGVIPYKGSSKKELERLAKEDAEK